MDAKRFNLTPKEAIALQKELRTQVRIENLRQTPTLIAGCDVSMNRFAKDGCAGFVTLSYPELSLENESVAYGPILFPYIPSLLSFREIPLLLEAWEGLKAKPDLIVVDGVGMAHPRRLGIATHVGLALGVPTIGCAKSVLTGTYEEPGSEPGSRSPLSDPKTGELLGFALRTKRGVRPIFISPGHMIGLEQSVDFVFSTVRTYRLPEPTRLAHNMVNAYRQARTLQ